MRSPLRRTVFRRFRGGVGKPSDGGSVPTDPSTGFVTYDEGGSEWGYVVTDEGEQISYTPEFEEV